METFATEHGRGGGEEVVVANVVLLGSGYDTRGYRMGLAKRGIKVYEVDARGTQAEKKKVLQHLGMLDNGGMEISRGSDSADAPTYVPCDFQSEDWMECLLKNYFDGSLPTLVIWEGVTMYLPKPIILSTLDMITRQGNNDSKNASPWYIAFDYVDSKWASSRPWKHVMKLAKEPFQFDMREEEPEVLIEFVGLRMLKHTRGGSELAGIYSSIDDRKEPDGILGNYGGFVLAGTSRPLSDQ